MRFELTTLTLARLCSTPELRPHPLVRAEICVRHAGCKWKNSFVQKNLGSGDGNRRVVRFIQ